MFMTNRVHTIVENYTTFYPLQFRQSCFEKRKVYVEFSAVNFFNLALNRNSETDLHFQKYAWTMNMDNGFEHFTLLKMFYLFLYFILKML